MARTLTLVFVGICALTSNAFAGDLSIKSRWSQTTEINDNYFLLPKPKGETYRSLSSIGFDFLTRTPTTNYLLTGDISYFRYLGPGAADTSLTKGKNDNAALRVDHTGKDGLTKYNFEASFSERDVAASQLADTGVVTATGQAITYKATAGFSNQINPLDQILFSTSALATSFTSSTNTPYSTLSNNVDWIHHLNRSVDIKNTASLDWTLRDDASRSETLYGRLMTGLRSELTRQLTFNASTGVALVKSSGTPLLLPSASTGIPAGGLVLGWLANLDIGYKLNAITTLTMSASRTIAPDVFGNLIQRDTLGGSVAYVINNASRISISGSFQNIGASTNAAPSQSLSANATFDHQLTQEWRTQLSYIYRHRITDSTNTAPATDATSNGVTLLVARDFTILP